MSTEHIVPSRDEVFRDVQAIVARHACVKLDVIVESAHLYDDLGCDSLTAIEITMGVEEHFGIVVPDELAEEMLVVGAIVDGVVDLLNRAPVG